MNTAGVIATYETHSQAEAAIRDLNHAGFSLQQLSIIGKGYHSEERPVGFYTVSDRMKSWGGAGAFWGALWGMLFAAVFFWIPGFGLPGPAGPFGQLLAGALEGAVLAGGVSVLGAALAHIGVPGDAIVKYEGSISADSYLLLVHGSNAEIEQARAIIERSGTVDADPFDSSGEKVSGPVTG